MKNLIYVALMCVTLSSCRIAAPTFQGVDAFKFERIDGNGIKMGCDVKFHNPNRLRFKVTNIEINVIMDDKLIGTLGEKDDIIIDRLKDFSIPVGLKLKPDGTIFDNIKKIIDIFRDKEADLFVVGELKVKTLCFLKFKIPIKYQKKIKLSEVR